MTTLLPSLSGPPAATLFEPPPAPPSSPPSPSRTPMALTVAEITNIVVRLCRASTRARSKASTTTASPSSSSNATGGSAPNPVTSRKRTMSSEKGKEKAHQQHPPPIQHLSFSSGAPQMHPCFANDSDLTSEEQPQRRVPVAHGDTFTCTGGVDVPRLLRASRASLLDKASLLGANVLIDESWTCSIRQPKIRRDGSYRVQIRYNASASRSNHTPDPHKPVALDKAKSVPGLMTIVQREEFSP